jgi:hypothetical protein
MALGQNLGGGEDILRRLRVKYILDSSLRTYLGGTISA